jgi:hypothetical protein
MWLEEDLSLESVRGFPWSSNQVKGREDLEEIRDAAAGAENPLSTSLSPVFPLLVRSPIPILGASNLYFTVEKVMCWLKGRTDAL